METTSPPRPLTEFSLALLEAVEQKLEQDLKDIRQLEERVEHKIRQFSSNGKDHYTPILPEEACMLMRKSYVDAYLHQVRKELTARRAHAEWREQRRLEREQAERREEAARLERERATLTAGARKWIMDQWDWRTPLGHTHPPKAKMIVREWLANDGRLHPEVIREVCTLAHTHLYPGEYFICLPGRVPMNYHEVPRDELAEAWGRLWAMEVESAATT